MVGRLVSFFLGKRAYFQVRTVTLFPHIFNGVSHSGYLSSPHIDMGLASGDLPPSPSWLRSVFQGVFGQQTPENTCKMY